MFSVTGSARARLAWLWWLSLASALYGGVTVLVAVLHPAGKSDPKSGLIVLYLLVVGFGGAAVVMLRTERRPVTITADGSVLRVGRFGAARLVDGAVVGVWYQEQTGVALGSVLHLRGERGPIRVGALGHEPPEPRDPATTAAAAAKSVHVTVSAEDFEAIRGLFGRPAPSAPDPVTRVELYALPRGASAGQVIALLGVLFGGGAVISLAATAVMSLHRPGLAIWVGDGGAALLVVALAVTATLMFRGRPRTAAAYTIAFDRGTATVRAGDGQILASARPEWRPCRYRDYRSCTYPALELIVAPLAPMTVVVFDPSQAWLAPTPTTTRRPLTVGLPDWLRLRGALTG